MKMRFKPLWLSWVLLMAGMLPAWAQQEAPAFVGPGPDSDTLAAMPQTFGAVGSQERHYYFEDAGREMGYHLIVPERYDANTPMPLVVALHGYSVNYKFFPGVVPELAALAEQYGFIVATPMGYSISGWYGAPMTVPGSPPPVPDMPPPQTGTPEEQQRERDLSELDVLNVIDIVTGEYNIDSARIYLMGHSMGAFGVWAMGQEYVGRWAAMAPMSGINANAIREVDALKLARTPIMVAVGEQETRAVIDSKRVVAILRAAGGEVHYVEIAGGDHGSMVAPATAQIFEFFAAH